ncbi:MULTISPECIES: 3-deoxy-manno-octulosonate cytidylyltransferase [unclassified Campylobacter]|uniref:3-deoxy-manno-octulosonate cytidylyltransferase n=1 Tax=unclassified Campylobacter TaxID=2593542 RepID=UPI001237D154|nr:MULTISPECIES: 3-deoxy-manno-octulosonate cytidylyltransferase [unclassified Campylobacter]KAA6224966.1 3-deoxy-manno-octulosonate cytidylyltransferase [Campylobacter sp. LR196d]KAA6225288.1 3-deoxy-manno-octulosonate cytidylyltransferase [Campylobacter sp. LR286c]KAA6225593.1 3-deoxy-manno-octulosonate cytidylyltransferase [Campylobacter sp. LR185c]KAA6230413.1 3-deoxy-manno-octulosonate cytidylyltransferase [Campylobacter sp. LR291e]KAA6230562.1 3-deoxy-manno-octulosonate cytidylyltransfer
MIIIPARLKSTRFNEKILCKIGQYPMFIATAKKALRVDDVCIGVDDEKILNIAKDYGFKAVLTRKDHESGTDRINEVCQKLGLNENEIIINVQADEPFIEEENLRKFKEFAHSCLNKDAFMASCFKKIDKDAAQDSNLVKVVCDKFGFGLYFSRAKIPFERDNYSESFKGHLGIYAYSVKALKEFCAFPMSLLEKAEKLEQLRAIENGKKIKMLEISTTSIGIDTKQDYERALKEFNYE